LELHGVEDLEWCGPVDRSAYVFETNVTPNHYNTRSKIRVVAIETDSIQKPSEPTENDHVFTETVAVNEVAAQGDVASTPLQQSYEPSELIQTHWIGCQPPPGIDITHSVALF
jgi:hypothetical protein